MHGKALNDAPAENYRNCYCIGRREAYNHSIIQRSTFFRAKSDPHPNDFAYYFAPSAFLPILGILPARSYLRCFCNAPVGTEVGDALGRTLVRLKLSRDLFRRGQQAL